MNPTAACLLGLGLGMAFMVFSFVLPSLAPVALCAGLLLVAFKFYRLLAS